MSSNLTPDDFKAVYIQLGLGNKETGELFPLYKNCPNAKHCWNPCEIPVLENGSIDESERTKIPHPWIGEKFQELKLLCLGINMNDHGGFSACHNLIEEAREELKYRTKIRFGCDYKDYKGTFLFHRMGMYAALIAQSAGITMQLDSKTGLPTQEEVIRAFDFIAYTNHVKCSPTNKERSKPSWQMWEHCGSFILKDELAMLKPKILLVFGTSDNDWWLSEKVFDPNSVQIKSTLGQVQIKQASLGGQPIKLIVVPHTSARGGCAKKIMTDIQEALLSVSDW
jgi:hypothetical protein